MRVLEKVKWLSVRNRYGIINCIDTTQVVFVPQTAIKNNPRKYLRSVGEGGTVELGTEREKDVEAANVTDRPCVGLQCKAVDKQST